MRRAFILVNLFVFLLFLTGCDGGAQEPALTVRVKNAQEDYVLDLASPAQEEDDPTQFLEEDIALWTQPLAVFSYGDLTATLRNARLDVIGDMLGKEDGEFRVHLFSGKGLPREFYILVQTGEEIRMSNLIRTGRRFGQVTYDMQTNKAYGDLSMGDGFLGLLIRYALMLAITVLIARYHQRISRWLVVLGVSLFTKLLVNVACAFAYPYSMFMTLLIFIAVELVVVPAEYALYFALLREEDPSALRRLVALSNILCIVITIVGYLMF